MFCQSQNWHPQISTFWRFRIPSTTTFRKTVFRRKFPRKDTKEEAFNSWKNNLNVVPTGILIRFPFQFECFVTLTSPSYTNKVFLCRSRCATTWSYWWQFTGLPKFCHSPSPLFFRLYFSPRWESWLLKQSTARTFTILSGLSRRTEHCSRRRRCWLAQENSPAYHAIFWDEAEKVSNLEIILVAWASEGGGREGPSLPWHLKFDIFVLNF